MCKSPHTHILDQFDHSNKYSGKLNILKQSKTSSNLLGFDIDSSSSIDTCLVDNRQIIQMLIEAIKMIKLVIKGVGITISIL